MILSKLARLAQLSILILATNPVQADQVIETVAGGGPNNVPALSAFLQTPRAVVVDANGNLFIAAEYPHRVFKVTTAGLLTIIAGTGSPEFGGDGGPATSAGLRSPADLALDTGGNLFIVDRDNSRIRRVDAVTGLISTVAGNGDSSGFHGDGGDGGPATSAGLSPLGVALDAANNLFIADTNRRVRRVDVVSGIISTVAGNGSFGSSGDGGPATSASLSPAEVVVDAVGNLLISDPTNHRIRRVDAVTGIISTVAGNGGFGSSGDGGPATSASLVRPSGLALDTAGNLFIADSLAARIRRVDSITGMISTVAGGGSSASRGDGGPATSARFGHTPDVAVDGAGHLFIADVQDSRIRRVDSATGLVSTVAGGGTPGSGGDGNSATGASLGSPSGIALDTASNLFIADRSIHRIRTVDAATGIISTVAGSGIRGFGGDDGPALDAQLESPRVVALDTAGNLFIADSGNMRIRRVDSISGIISTVAGNGSMYYSGDGGPATSAGLSPSDVALDAANNLFIADVLSHRIRRVDAATGIISTVAGNGSMYYSGDEGPAVSAGLPYPGRLALDTADNLFVNEEGSHRIRRVDAATGIISTVAGSHNYGRGGDGGPARNAVLNNPTGMALDKFGNLFIADSGNNPIRRVDAVTGIISTIAGNGVFGYSGDGGGPANASLAWPVDVAIDPEGSSLYIADLQNNRIRGVFVANQPPVALCRNVIVSAGEMTCTVGASINDASFDPDGDPISVVQEPPGPYGLGDHLVTLIVHDGRGSTDSCQAIVTVLDTTPPEINIGLEPSLLWPPNHRLMSIEAAVTATDACGPTTVQLSSIASNEPDDGAGDGATTGDIQEALFGSIDLDFALRAERAGDGNGRVYTVVYTATDGAGKQASTSSIVVVPHDQEGVVEPVILSVQDEGNGTYLNWTPVPNALFYNVISGQVGAIRNSGSSFDLGATTCIEAASEDVNTRGHEDIVQPLPGEAIFYLVEYFDGWNAGYGTAGSAQPRSFTGGCSAPPILRDP